MSRIIDESKTKVKLNLQDARRFLKALAGDSLLTFQTFDDKKKNRKLARIFHGQFEDLQADLIALNEKEAGIFHMPNQGDGHGRKEENVIKVRAFYLDLDGSPLEPVLEWQLSPHIITETSPGRYQCFWLVSDCPVDKKIFCGIQIALCSRFNGDPAITKDLCRVMRVPGFIHQKNDPFLSRIIKLTDAPQYRIEDILNALGLDLERAQNGSIDNSVLNKADNGQELHRNVTLTSMAGRLRRQGFDQQGIKETIGSQNEKKYDPPLPQEEVETISKSIGKKPSGKRKDFLPMPFVETILARNHVISYSGDIYTYREGCYFLWTEAEVQKYVLDLSGDKLRPRQLEEIFKLLTIKCHVIPDDVNPPNLLNLRNGVLDPYTGTLYDHCPEQHFTVQIDAKWNEEKECPEFKRLLNRVLPDEDQQLLLSQIFGICLTTDARFQKGFMLIGNGANGKSVIANILAAILGPNCTAISLGALSKSCFLAELRNKTANITNEIDVNDFVQDSIVKQIISGDRVTADEKYKRPIKFNPTAKMVVTTNNYPKTYDKSYGYYRRWIILPFNVTIPEDEQDLSLSDRIISRELDGVLKWSVEGLQRLNDDGKFMIPEASKDALKDYEKEMNPVLIFFEDQVSRISSGNAKLYLNDLYVQYRIWCFHNGHRQMSRQKVRAAFEYHYQVQYQKDHRGKYVQGFGCRESE